MSWSLERVCATCSIAFDQKAARAGRDLQRASAHFLWNFTTVSMMANKSKDVNFNVEAAELIQQEHLREFVVGDKCHCEVFMKYMKTSSRAYIDDHKAISSTSSHHQFSSMIILFIMMHKI
jgi:superfamily II DNA helicase RecQ